jgi:hypothetical protein
MKQGSKEVLTWNFETNYGARNRVGIGLSYLPARLTRLEELIPWIDSWAP